MSGYLKRFVSHDISLTGDKRSSVLHGLIEDITLRTKERHIFTNNNILLYFAIFYKVERISRHVYRVMCRV